MKIFLGPQINDNNRVFYEFEDDIVKATIGDITDTFDFTGFPDGVLTMVDEDTGEELIKTPLPVNPFTSAEKVDGVLYLELLNWIPSNASEEVLFPDWIDAVDYVAPEEVITHEPEETVEEQ